MLCLHDAGCGAATVTLLATAAAGTASQRASYMRRLRLRVSRSEVKAYGASRGVVRLEPELSATVPGRSHLKGKAVYSLAGTFTAAADATSAESDEHCSQSCAHTRPHRLQVQ